MVACLDQPHLDDTPRFHRQGPGCDATRNGRKITSPGMRRLLLDSHSAVGGCDVTGECAELALEIDGVCEGARAVQLFWHATD